MSTEMRDDRPVRTYRGRSLEELIPKIREELGPDAIILREREGLTGGFNGFFQQRCVEVDAQAAPSVDFYDEEDDALPGDAPPAETQDAASAPTQPAADEPAPAPAQPWQSEPAPAPAHPWQSEPAPAPAQPWQSEPAPAPAQPWQDEPAPDPQAAAPSRPVGWPHETPRQPAPVAETEPEAPSPYASAAQSYTETPYDVAPVPAQASDAPSESAPTEAGGPDVTAWSDVPGEPPFAPDAEPAAARQPAPPARPEELTFAQRLAQARQEREALSADAERQAAHPRSAEPQPAEPPAAPAAEPPAAGPPAAPAAEPAAARGNLRVVDASSPRATVTPIPSAPAREPADLAARRPPATLRPFPSAPSAAAGGQLDSAAAGAIARDLAAQGISEAWAHELIVTAAAHLTPFTPGGDLRAAVRSVIAGGIMAPPPLPSSGAAVAFVGPGGSGKSRCSAALAAAYRRASTLQTHVVCIGGGPRAADTAGLLADRDISVDLLRGAAAADAIARGRERGLVVVDTDTTSPVDAQGVAALADTLAPLGLDAVYLTLPATMSATAARGLLDGLEPLRPTALVITHADEANELGIVAELAYLSGLPIAFIHGGLNLDTSLVATDPAAIAARVLP